MKHAEHITQNTKNETSTFTLCCLLMAIMIISSAATDMYVPSLPYLAHYFQATPDDVKWTITLYLLGFVISQLIYGPLSDRYGRKAILLSALSIALFGSILCVFANSIYMLWLGRFIQGLGVCVTLIRSIAQDKFHGPQLSQVVATLSVAYGFAPVIAPLVGGYLQEYFHWRSVFVVLFLYLSILSLVIWKLLPETNGQQHHDLTWKRLTNDYKLALTNNNFLVHAICASAAMSGVIGYYAMSPFLLQKTLGLSAVEYSWLVVVVAAGMLIGKGLNTLLIKKFDLDTLIVVGNSLMLSGAGIMLIFGMLGYLSVTLIVLPFILFTTGTGLVFSNAMVAAFRSINKAGGTASAVYTCIQIGGTFCASILVAHLSQNTQIPLAIFLTILSLSSFLLHFCYTYHTKSLSFSS
jgi:DHA1 family 2-module integral membrane pump EmrD-like MFS transporter